MKCDKCSSELPDKALFCPICGAKQEYNNDIETQVEIIEQKLNITDCCFSKKGRIDCQEWIKEFGFEEVCTAVDITLKQYLKFDDEDNPIRSTANEVFNKISGICYNRKSAKITPYLADTQKMVNYSAKKFYLSEYQEREYKDYISRILRFYSRETDYADLFENLFWQLKRSNDKWEFLDFLKEIADKWEDCRN